MSRDPRNNYFDETFKEYFEQRQFGILKKARDQNTYIHNMANKNRGKTTPESSITEPSPQS